MNRTALATLALALFAVPAIAQELTGKTFQKWKAYIEPGPEELKWRSIPWRVAFGEAAREAWNLDKPILAWMMNGHPLACT
jgi:hypothetical protein